MDSFNVGPYGVLGDGCCHIKDTLDGIHFFTRKYRMVNINQLYGDDVIKCFILDKEKRSDGDIPLNIKIGNRKYE